MIRLTRLVLIDWWCCRDLMVSPDATTWLPHNFEYHDPPPDMMVYILMLRQTSHQNHLGEMAELVMAPG